eukprot:m.167112 g.167112  ORF g.167112 m.167112 type:complete len:272 (+) comp17190_c0_seq1:128-943(+)
MATSSDAAAVDLEPVAPSSTSAACAANTAVAAAAADVASSLCSSAKRARTAAGTAESPAGTIDGDGDCKRSLNVLLAASGSVAAIKIPQIVSRLKENNAHLNVRVVATEHAQHFFRREELTVPFFTDADEWTTWSKMGDAVLHIELRAWADVLVVAPLDANTLAKLANGLCDNLLTCVARAWDFARPAIVCPAMNTKMWEHPVTGRQLDTLRSYGYQVVPPISKTLACGDIGNGAMASVDTIVERILTCLEESAKAASGATSTSTAGKADK